MKRPLLLLLTEIALVLTFGVQGALAFSGMELVSTSSGGLEGNDVSGASSVSSGGRYIAFQSVASNLVSPATSNFQIFVRDRQTGATTLVSAGPGGAYGDSNSFDPSISGNGRYVGFESPATNLVSPASSGNQVFVRDTQAGTTALASVNASGVQGNDDSFNASLSSDGRYIAFQSPATNLVSPASSGNQIFVRDTQAGTTTLVSVNAGGDQCDGYSSNPSISPDGRYVSFESWSTNLVSPPTSNSYSQIFVHDRQTGANWLASKGPGGSEGNASSEYSSISADGRNVAFYSDATNLVSPATSGTQVFVYDRQSDAVTLVSVNTSVSEGNNISRFPCISADGRYIAFYSWASNLVSPATSGVQVFLRDRQAGVTTLVSMNASGEQGNNYSAFPSISANGSFVAFTSGATNLVSPPTGSDQIFVAGPYSPPPPPTFTITATAGANGSISPSGVVTVSSGDSKTFTITANAGYQIADVQIDGSSAGAVSSCTFINITANHTISASYTLSKITANNNRSSNDTFGWIDSGTESHGEGAGSAGTPTTTQPPVMLPDIQVQSASLSASRIVPGELITVIARVANIGAANGTVSLVLYVNGQKESSQDVTVSSSNIVPVTFTFTRSEPGSYSVYVGGTQAGTFVVDRFSNTNIILYISVALILVAFVIGAIYIARRRQT